MLGTESAEASNAPIPAKESQSKESTAESIVGIQHRLVRIRLLWTSADFVPAGSGYLPPKPRIPTALVGHTLSHEQLAPLRC